MCIRDDDITVILDNSLPSMDLCGLFPQDAPVHIEVGSGKGTFLLNQARANPGINYLGIEWANKFYRYSVDRMRRWQISNVRVLRTDARDFIRRCLAAESVATFHVYFPDPWPKKRHHKRRFFTESNVLEVLRCLKLHGELRAATDHAEYFEAIQDVLLGETKTAKMVEQIEFFATDAADPGEWVGSNFERKYLKEGRKIYTLAVKRIPQK